MGLLLTGLLTGCLGQSDESSYTASYGAPEPAYSKSGGFDRAASEIATSEDTTIDRKIIKTGSISIEVSEFDSAAAVVEQLAAAAGGFVSNSNSYITSEGQKRGTITIRVPAVGFDSVLGEIKKLGEVKSTSSSGQDVTEEYIDLEARLTNYKRQEGRFLSILDNATTVEDVLKVEEQLGRVRGEIERIEGRLRYLDNYIDLSTITVSLQEPTPITRKWGLRDALSDSVEGFIGMTNALIIFTGSIIPVLIFVLVLFGIFRRLRRRRQPKAE